MAPSVQIWRPDTCGCVIEQTHDPQDTSVPIGLSRVLAKCAVHAALSDAEVWDTVFDWDGGENRRKNRIRARLKEAFGEQADIASWSFSGTGATRVITVVTVGLTSTQIANAQAWCDSRPRWAGRVVVT
jgi:hypothetical protein